MIRKGHATASESSRVEALEEKLRNRKITSDEQLELALLNIEPGHDGFRAIEVLREIPAESPQFNLARQGSSLIVKRLQNQLQRLREGNAW
jgi:hypothetical protein